MQTDSGQHEMFPLGFMSLSEQKHIGNCCLTSCILGRTLLLELLIEHSHSYLSQLFSYQRIDFKKKTKYTTEFNLDYNMFLATLLRKTVNNKYRFHF